MSLPPAGSTVVVTEPEDLDLRITDANMVVESITATEVRGYTGGLAAEAVVERGGQKERLAVRDLPAPASLSGGTCGVAGSCHRRCRAQASKSRWSSFMREIGAYTLRARRSRPGPTAAATAAATARTTAAGTRQLRARMPPQASSMLARRGNPLSRATSWTVETLVSATS